MKKTFVLSVAACAALAFTSCKSSESAYKKAYEKAKQQELAETNTAAEAVDPAPVVISPVTTSTSNATVREEKVQLVSGSGLKAYSVVCGSFGVQANAESLKEKLDAQGYDAKVVLAPEKNMYRVVVASYDDRAQAAQARDEFKARHTDNSDFQKSWLLYRVY
jgi:cell division protein FtsN